MLALHQNVLREDLSAIDSSSYSPTQRSAGIAHLCVGNVIHAHPAYYTGKFLNLSNQPDWGIRIVSLPSSDHPEELSFINVNGAITDVIPARADWEKAVSSLADPAIKIIALSLTKGGFKSATPDAMHSGQSSTAFDILTKALARRREQNGGPLTILSCDDLPRNGDTTQKAFLSFVQDAGLADWIRQHVAFPNSVANALPPTPSAETQAYPGQGDRIADHWEDTADWVIEDHFSAGRPDWDMAGVTFVDDSTPHEVLKQRFQNAAYSLLAYPAFLTGYRTVREAMRDSVFSNYVTIFVNRLVNPLTATPEGIDLTRYKEKLLSRLSSEGATEPLSELCADGAYKLPTFVLPTLTGLAEQGKSTYCLAFFLAAYGHYLAATADDKGVDYDVDEPHLSEADWCLIKDPDVLAFLDSSPLASADLRAIPHLAAAYKLYRKQIAIYGVSFTLRQTMCTFLELH